MNTERGYQRAYLRAPLKDEILFSEDNYVFKALSLNISEGGMLLESIGYYPKSKVIPFMVRLKQFPYFKNYSLQKLQSYDHDSESASVVRFSASIMRRIEITSQVEGTLKSRIAIKIIDISPFNKARISNYVDTISSNLIYLQVLIDSVNSDKNNILKIKIIAQALGYTENIKISLLRKLVEDDYKSLQWL